MGEVDGADDVGGAAGTGPGTAVGAPTDALREFSEALESAGDLDPDARLELLRRVEAGISEALDGLDGL